LVLLVVAVVVLHEVLIPQQQRVRLKRLVEQLILLVQVVMEVRMVVTVQIKQVVLEAEEVAEVATTHLMMVVPVVLPLRVATVDKVISILVMAI
jgi:hypothetical protein